MCLLSNKKAHLGNANESESRSGDVLTIGQPFFSDWGWFCRLPLTLVPPPPSRHSSASKLPKLSNQVSPSLCHKQKTSRAQLWRNLLANEWCCMVKTGFSRWPTHLKHRTDSTLGPLSLPDLIQPRLRNPQRKKVKNSVFLFKFTAFSSLQQQWLNQWVSRGNLLQKA